MTVILDTHTWIWWAADRSRLTEVGRHTLQTASCLGVCAISCWEVAMLAAKGRIDLAVDTATWLKQALAISDISLLPLSADVAAVAAKLSLHGDPADRLIAATAILMNAPLMTRDEKLQSFSDLKTIW